MQIQFEELAGFLFGEKGALAMFLGINREEGNSRSELYDMAGVADSTGKRRVEKAIDLGLFEPKLFKSGEHGNTKRTCLTEEGQEIRELLSEFGVEKYYKQHMKTNKKLNNSISEFIANIQEEGEDETSTEVIEPSDIDIHEEEYHVHPFFGHKYD